MQLFENIKPLFANKPLVVVANKSDIIKVDALPEVRRWRGRGCV